jgi:hypothetical protein
LNYKRRLFHTGLLLVVKVIRHCGEFVFDSADVLFVEKKVRSPKFRLGKRIF